MSRAAKKLVEEFTAPLLPHELPDEDSLTEAADELFSELDRAEQPK
jgi:hypothetical protein